MTRTIIFKVLKHFGGKISNFETPDWSTNDVNKLNSNFYWTVKTNSDNFLKHEKISETLDLSLFDYLFKTEKYKLKIMYDKFKIAIPAYDDVFNRDNNAFYQKRVEHDVDLYVCILLDDDSQYLGHIYCWISCRKCMGFGIRCNVDNFFNKNKVKVSLRLFEAIRIFALENNCNEIFIIDPFPNVERILKTLNFEQVFRYEQEVKNKFMGYWSFVRMRDLQTLHREKSVNGFALKNLNSSLL